MQARISRQDGEVHYPQGNMVHMQATKRLLATLLTLICSGCAMTEVKEPKPAEPIDVSAAPRLETPVWSRELPGLITEVQMAPNGDVVLSTRPEQGRGSHAIFRYSAQGKLRWRAAFKNLVRSLSISPEGDRVYYNAYQDELGVLSERGKVLWKRQALCRPYSLPAKRVLCFQDDDNHPGLAFEIWSETGERASKKESTVDAIDIALSLRHERFALGYAGGKVEFVDALSGASRWERQIEGEIVDLGIADALDRVAVLFTDLKKGKRLVVFNGNGSQLGELPLGFSAEQVVFAPGTHLLLAVDPGGTAPRFQVIQAEGEPTALWEKESRQPAEYAVGAQPLAQGWMVYLGVEGSTGKLVRTAEIAALAAQPPGTPLWRARIAVPAGGYIYAYAGNAQAGWLAVATDLGRLISYRIP